MYKQYKNNITQNYLLDSSPWPLVASLGALFITFGGVMYMHLYKNGLFFLIGLFTIIHIMYCCWRDIFCGLYFDFYIKPRRSFWMSRVLLLIFKIANNLVNYVLIYGQSNFWEPILFFSDKKKTNKDSLIDSQNLKKNGGELTFKNRAFYFKNNRLPEILSLNNCKDLAESLQLLDEPSFNRFVQYSYSKKESKTIFMFINSLRLKGILDEFILFFITKKKFNIIKPYPIFTYTSPIFMRRLSLALLIETQNERKITNEFLVNLEKLLVFNKNEKKELITVFTNNPSKTYNTIKFWLL